MFRKPKSGGGYQPTDELDLSSPPGEEEKELFNVDFERTMGGNYIVTVTDSKGDSISEIAVVLYSNKALNVINNSARKLAENLKDLRKLKSNHFTIEV